MPPHADVVVAAPLSVAGRGGAGWVAASPTSPAKVRVALPPGRVARTSQRAALAGLARASPEEVRTPVAVPAVLRAEEAVLDAAAGVVVARLVVIAR